MTCPKCGAESRGGAVECAVCGIVFARYRPRAQPVPRDLVAEPEREDWSEGPDPRQRSEGDSLGPAEPAALDEPEGWGARLGALLFPEPPPTNTPSLVARAAFLLALAVWGASFVLAGPRSVALGESFLHLIHLVFHEAGHVVFMPFGRFLMVLGGGLFQVLVPLVFVVYFVRWREDVFAASVCTFWAGHSLMDLAPYISDARALDLVLLGGRTGKEVEGHDFEYLLTATGLLQWDITLGRLVFLTGTLLIVAGLLWGAGFLWRQRSAVSSHPRS